MRIEGDMIMRVEGDETISVSARVTLYNVSASGFVLLRKSELATAASSPHVRLARARAWQALSAMLGNDHARAFEAAKKGTEELSTVLYVGNRGVKLAELSRMNNDMPDAARTMAASLHASLRAYTRRFHDEVW